MRPTICALALLLALAATSTAGAAVRPSWAQHEVATVVSRGLFRGPAVDFRPDEPLTKQALAHAVAKLTGGTEPALADGAAPVTLEQLDTALVRALALGDAAYRFSEAARAAGLQPAKRFGSEVVARLLGLRLNHPAGEDDLERRPQEIASRAEAAYSFAQVVGLAGGDAGADRRHATSAQAPAADLLHSWPVESARAAAESFSIPDLAPWQRQILGTAVSYVGYPYVWGGTGDGTPGFDCSGFVWRVYKLTRYDGEGQLAETLRGRTTMAMSGEVKPRQRIRLADLAPGDVLFFGRGPRSKPAQVDHTGIYLGNGWFVHSSRYGVTVIPLDGWYRESLAWARRPLAEAGLVGALPAS
jgi:cell wall-associated NlpC family hydrolase